MFQDRVRMSLPWSSPRARASPDCEPLAVLRSAREHLLIQEQHAMNDYHHYERTVDETEAIVRILVPKLRRRCLWAASPEAMDQFLFNFACDYKIGRVRMDRALKRFEDVHSRIQQVSKLVRSRRTLRRTPLC